MSDRIKELEAKTKIRQSSMNKLKEIRIRISDIQDILRDIERDISLYEDTLQRYRNQKEIALMMLSAANSEWGKATNNSK